MADEMRVDADALRKRSPKFAEAGDKLTTAFEALKGVHQAEDGCWGSDETGAEFGKEYKKGWEEAEGAFNELGKLLSNTKDQLNETAAQWDSDDESSAAGIENAGSAL